MYIGHDGREYEDPEMGNMLQDARQDSADIPDILAQMTEIDQTARAIGMKNGVDRLEGLLKRYQFLKAQLETKREQQFLATACVLKHIVESDSVEALATFLRQLALHWTGEALALVHSTATVIDVVDRLSNIVEED